MLAPVPLGQRSRAEAVVENCGRWVRPKRCPHREAAEGWEDRRWVTRRQDRRQEEGRQGFRPGADHGDVPGAASRDVD